MCGRYKLSVSRLKKFIKGIKAGNDYFSIHGPIKYHDIVLPSDFDEDPDESDITAEMCPGSDILMINNKLELEEGYWTIRDKTWKGETVSCINAKAETIWNVGMFRDAIREDRVLIPANSVLEWQLQPDKTKKKFELWFDGDPTFAFAGIARYCEINGQMRRCTVIITTKPNEIFNEIHNSKRRQPVVIRKEDYAEWLDTDTPFGEINRMMQPLPSSETKFKEIVEPAKPKSSRSKKTKKV
jgi:putative SOS response-associated peptidase YedK